MRSPRLALPPLPDDDSIKAVLVRRVDLPTGTLPAGTVLTRWSDDATPERPATMLTVGDAEGQTVDLPIDAAIMTYLGQPLDTALDALHYTLSWADGRPVAHCRAMLRAALTTIAAQRAEPAAALVDPETLAAQIEAALPQVVSFAPATVVPRTQSTSDCVAEGPAAHGGPVR